MKKTVGDVSRMTGVSVRTLQYYDRIGLLKPSEYTQAGYRLYDDTAIEKLMYILLFRELEFPLKDIKRIMDSPAFDKGKALDQQIELLNLKKEHIESLISLAAGIREIGVDNMELGVFDKTKIKEYMEKAREQWGDTAAFAEFEAKSEGRTDEQQDSLSASLMAIFAQFGKIRDLGPESEEAQALAGKLQKYITDNYYTCTDEILAGLGSMYAAGGEFTENIDKAGGEGTARFASEAIEIFTGR